MTIFPFLPIVLLALKLEYYTNVLVFLDDLADPTSGCVILKAVPYKPRMRL